jgi:hypothetical protein
MGDMKRDEPIMNGKIFTWDNVRKNKESGEFEELTH